MSDVLTVMRSVLDEALDTVVGAVEVERTPEGATFHRVPRGALARLEDLSLTFASTVTSGVRLEAVTDAPAIEIDVQMTRVLAEGMTNPGEAFDVVVDGVVHQTLRSTDATIVFIDLETQQMRFAPGGIATLRVELGVSGVDRTVQVWLPASAVVTLRDVRIPGAASLRPAPQGGAVWVHHGSSISQCSEARRPTETWPALVARSHELSLVNLGLGGQCMLDQFMATVVRDHPADLISLELGINVVNGDAMRERAFVSAVHGFLDTVRDGHPTTPIAVITPIVCPVAETHPGPTVYGTDLQTHVVDRPGDLAVGALTLARVRELLAVVVGKRRDEGDEHLHLVDGLSLFGAEDVDELPDGLHPSPEGYRRMADRFARAVLHDGGPFTPRG